MLSRQIFLVVFATLHLTAAFNNLISPDKESIFKWKALVKAGTNLPQPYASQFVLYGQIHIQPSNNSISVKISNLSHQLYNGIVDHVSENEAQNVTVPQEFKLLEKDFSIVYNSDGLVDEILTAPGEKTFSLNIKRSLATVFQLNNSVVNKEYKYPEAFDTKEDSIYGYGNVNYNIVPKDEVVEVTKLLEIPDPEVLYTVFAANTGDYPCDAKYEQMIMQDNVKKYRIIKDDAGLVVDRIVSIGSIVYYPFQAKSDYQFIEIIQEFELEEVVPIKTRYLFDSPSLVHGKLLNVPFNYNPEDLSITDITNGRRNINYEKLIAQVKHLLEDIPQYLNQDNIHIKDPTSERGQAINRLQGLLMQFNTEKLEELRQQLSDDTLNAFYHILPVVGTKSSVVYIKNLIVNKKVEDTIAVKLLQHIHDTLDIFAKPVSDVEELIHLNDSFSWEVRKVAILSFGNLIYKEYNYAKTDQQAQERFEKYIIEYINRIKQAKEYKVKATYLIGLRNMKLPLILKYLVPPFNDDLFENHHLRVLGLWAIAPVLLASKNPNTIMEAYWPILTNPQEYTELKIIAYYYIITSKPSYSTLRNLLFYMLLEKDEEVYHFFYTSLKELSQTTDPCRQELRTQAAQILKFTPPPNHGFSSASFATYRDVKYGFGEGLERYYISANTSSLYGIFFNSHHFNIIQEEYMIYVKTYTGTKGKPLLSKSILQNLDQVFGLNNPDYTDPFIEGAVLKRDQCINIFYFDKNDPQKFLQSLGQFLQPSVSHLIDTLHINYHWYHRALLPTDLGIPAVWEFLKPLVQQHKIKISKNNSEEMLQINNRHVIWGDYRHGLSFYNPVADVWQGINRIHAYDAVLPINIEFALKIRPFLLNVFWKKQENKLLNVAGVKSHVHQAVFVDDEYGRSVLQQSSPGAKNYQVVTYGKQYRDDYTLVDYDDLNTGHKWYVGVYDSNIHVSEGSFKHQMELFTQLHTKQINSLFDYFLLSFQNWHTYTVLMPDPGIHGFIVRVEPSFKYSTSGINFIFEGEMDNWNSDRAFLHARLLNFKVYYGINDGKYTLKRWIISWLIASNDGRSEIESKFEIWKSPDDYKLRIERLIEQSKEGIDTKTSVFLNNHSIIDIKAEERRSLEQKNGHHNYEECQYVVPYFKQHYYTPECILARTSLRHASYAVNIKEGLSDWKDSWNNWWEFIKSQYRSYYSYEKRENRISENNIYIDLAFPIQTREVDVHIATSEYIYKLTGISRDHGSWNLLSPTTFSSLSDIIFDQKLGRVDHCSIYPNYFTINGKTASDAAPDEYTLYFGDRKGFSNVYVKNAGNNELAVKIEDGNNTVELIPKDNSYEIKLNEKNNFVEEYHNAWLYYYVFMEDPDKLSLFVLERSGIYLKYNSHSLLTIAHLGIGSRGACFEHK